MISASYYNLYKPVPERFTEQFRKAILRRPYKELQRNNISVRVYDYRIVKTEALDDNKTVKEVREYLQNDGDSLLGTKLQVGDVIAMTKDGITFAYYVDPNRLILLPDFFSQPSPAALISLETTEYIIDGRKGSWLSADSAMIDGKLYYLMLSETYGRKAPYVIIDDCGTVMTTDKQGFTEDCISRIRETERQLELKRQADRAATGLDGLPHLENWQKRYENGEYLRAAEMSTEQNYNMIDGIINNGAADHNGQRRSVLDRLSEKKEEVHSSPAALQEVQKQLIDGEKERIRK